MRMRGRASEAEPAGADERNHSQENADNHRYKFQDVMSSECDYGRSGCGENTAEDLLLGDSMSEEHNRSRGLDTDDRFNVCSMCVCVVLPDHLESILPDPAAIWVQSRNHVRSATI
ncbi:hypothetical protein DPX16_8220 [Anabarilius grahami]|uniref:Uncharacterized protein n=1 Tax=Anabarilius grahami TaxID=495550 RepID=A0A3N0Y8N1_ANAGA|nr:hypothetical protein DPX16_8220 [Anabarilius grahami]